MNTQSGSIFICLGIVFLALLIWLYLWLIVFPKRLEKQDQLQKLQSEKPIVENEEKSIKNIKIYEDKFRSNGKFLAKNRRTYYETGISYAPQYKSDDVAIILIPKNIQTPSSLPFIVTVISAFPNELIENITSIRGIRTSSFAALEYLLEFTLPTEITQAGISITSSFHEAVTMVYGELEVGGVYLCNIKLAEQFIREELIYGEVVRFYPIMLNCLPYSWTYEPVRGTTYRIYYELVLS